jgi:quercetin dioxygenase-like cupin family protein
MCKDINTNHHFSSGVYAREMHLPKGWKAESHKHKFDHMSILASGHVIVEANEVSTEYIAPCVLEVKAGIVHSVYGVEDSTWFCIHATEERDMLELEKILIEES